MDIRIALAGNPNCGKTTLFNALTGSNQFVGNWPGVTVEKKEGKLKKHEGVTVVDLPGIYSLSPYTLEEVVARNYLIDEKPDVILNIVDGSNLDDDGDYRPGHKALKELAIVSPLHEAGMRKADIRALSKVLGLPTWDKPSFACLASRFPYGTVLTPEGLARVNRAEEFLMAKGFRQLRVRAHGAVARIELVPEDIPRFLEKGLREETAAYFKHIGFAYTALDLLGYRTGSLNETLQDTVETAEKP